MWWREGSLKIKKFHILLDTNSFNHSVAKDICKGRVFDFVFPVVRPRKEEDQQDQTVRGKLLGCSKF